MKKQTVSKVLVIPVSGELNLYWKVRLIAPRFPFYIDSQVGYVDKADADKQAEKWKGRKISVTVGQSAP